MANTAQADTIYQTGFEKPPFVAGSFFTNGVGQDGWKVGGLTGGELLNPDAAVITSAVAKRGSQSVEVRGANMNSTVTINPDTGKIFTDPSDAVGSYRKPLNYTLTGKNTLVRVDADMLLATNQPKTDIDFFGFTIALRDGNGVALGEVGLFSNGQVLAYPVTTKVGENTPEKFSRPIRFNKWYRITMLLDTANDTTAYFIDKQFIGAVHAPSNPPAPDEPTDPPNPDRSNILDRGAMVVYALPDGGGKARANYTARLDNFRVSTHKDAPEID
jgi:hypothetical protein